MIKPTLSKTRYLSGDQCHLRLWYDTHAPDLAPDVDDTLQAVFDTGHEVGEIACRRYPGGHLVAQDYRHVAEALEQTQEVIATGTVPALFEAAFVHRGVLVRADVIERLPGGGWGLVEVKSTTRLKDVFVLDVAVQLWVCAAPDSMCAKPGSSRWIGTMSTTANGLTSMALFKLHPVMDQAESLLDSVVTGVREMQAMIEKDSPPKVAPGEHCFTPYSCPYYAHCTRDLPSPKHGLDELPWLSGQRRRCPESRGHRGDPATSRPTFRSHALQRIVRQAVREGRDSGSRQPPEGTCQGGTSDSLPGLRDLRACHTAFRRHAAL